MSILLKITFIVLSVDLQTSAACDGYQLIINRLATCIPNSLIRLEKFSVTLDANCNLTPVGCITTTKGYTTANVHYKINKPPMPPIEGDGNLCTALTNATDITTVFQLPNKCPVRAGKVCGRPDKKLSITQYKNRLPLAAGNTSMKVEIKHNNGVSCVDLHVTLKKLQKG